MDPYLEQCWSDVHANLATYTRDALQRQLPDDLVARVEEYVALEEADTDRPRGYYPDVKVTEHTVNGGAAPSASVGSIATAEPIVIALPSEAPTLRSIHILDRGNRVVTAIEVLSHANKIGTAGRNLYRRKRRDLVDGRVNLVEIDLLRDGDYVLFPPEWALPANCRGPFRISVIRGWKFFEAEVYPVPLRQRLPTIRIPLRETDADIQLDLQALIDTCYDNGRYARTIDYRYEPAPALQREDAAWADALLREKGLR